MNARRTVRRAKITWSRFDDLMMVGLLTMPIPIGLLCNWFAPA